MITTGETASPIVLILDIQQYLGSCGFRSGVEGVGFRNDQIGALRFNTNKLIGLFDQASHAVSFPETDPSMIMPLIEIVPGPFNALPQPTYQLLRRFWSVHRNPDLLFPNRHGGLKGVASATTPLDRGGVQTTLHKVIDACGLKKITPSRR